MARAGSISAALVIPAIAAAFLGLTGSGLFVRAAYSASPDVAPMQGKALIVFVRDLSSDASSVDYRRSPLFTLTGSDLKPEAIGILSARTKLAYHADPGKHLFMIVGENADFMAAEVLPNRTYHVLVSARVGNRAALFTFKAVDRQAGDAKDFDELLASSKWIENRQASVGWAASNMSTVMSKQHEYYKPWTQKPDSQRARLLPQQGTGGRP
jgi:hypothetical protein